MNNVKKSQLKSGRRKYTNIMLDKEHLIQLSKRDSIVSLNETKSKVLALNDGESELLDLTNEMFKMGSKSHLYSLNPIIREELGLQLEFMTQGSPQLQQEYKEKKNRYLSIGKSFASISYLFDLVKEDFVSLDIILMHELLMDDGEYREHEVFIQHPDGSKKTIPFENIYDQIEELIVWYYDLKKTDEISLATLAILFHYYILTIHPFLDGNGRISRLFLNLIFLKHSLFPVVIPTEKREAYYNSLIKADAGQYEELVDLIALLGKQKLEEYIKLTEGLTNLDNSIECLVLTEDGNTTMIENLLIFHGFDMQKTTVESYDGKDNVASAIFLAKKMKNKKPNLKHIIIHRDRDNDLPQQLQQVIAKLVKNNGLSDCTTIFVTKYYDMESYFLNEKHINETFPELTIDRAMQLVIDATNETSETSKQKLRIALYDFGKFAKIEDPQEKAAQINALYDMDPVKYRYGKAVLYKLEELITAELHRPEKISLVQDSSHIKVDELRSAKTKIDS